LAKLIVRPPARAIHELRVIKTSKPVFGTIRRIAKRINGKMNGKPLANAMSQGKWRNDASFFMFIFLPNSGIMPLCV
jgi:hypothetical protein